MATNTTSPQLPYWCRTCSTTVTNPTRSTDEEVVCPNCNTGFLEQIASRTLPLLFGLLGGTPSTSPESEPSGESDRGSERVILIDPLNQAIIIQSRDFDGLLNDFIGNEILRGGWVFGRSLASTPASEEAVKEMARVKVEDEEEQCSVCLEGFGEGVEAREMPCKHRYHERCIFKWLGEHNTCPVCRFQMPVQEQKPVSGESGAGEREEGEDEGRRSNSGRRLVLLSFPLVIAELVASGRRTGESADSGAVNGED